MDAAFSRRAFIILVAKTVLFLVLIIRLYYLSVIKYWKYAAMSKDNYIHIEYISPKRGNIVDIHGNKIASNEYGYDLCFLNKTNSIEKINEIMDSVSKYINITKDDYNRVLDRKNKKTSSIIRQKLSFKELAIMESRMLFIHGIGIVVDNLRKYTSMSTSHITGYVSLPWTEDQMKQYDGMTNVIYIGKSGVEALKDDELFGEPGHQGFEVNVSGDKFNLVEYKEPGLGNTVKLNIDLELQDYAYQYLSKRTAGAILLMDLSNGAILTMSSAPSYDCNKFTYYKLDTAKEYRKLQYNEYKPLINRCTHGIYAPGSVFKLVTAAAGDKWDLLKDISVKCDGYYQYNENYRYHCWTQHQEVYDVNNALKKSCDVYFYALARELGIDKIAEAARAIGFNGNHGLEMPEKYGIIPDPKWKHDRYKSLWNPGDTLISAIGQGYVHASPMEMLVSLSNLITGTKIKPRLLYDTPVDIKENEYFSKYTIAKIRRGAFSVVNNSGTGWKAMRKGYDICGKTGTSQVRTISQEERASEGGVKKNSELPWEMRDHGLFFGFAPYKNPRFACIAVIEHGGTGGVVAAPVVGSLLKNAIDKQNKYENNKDAEYMSKSYDIFSDFIN